MAATLACSLATLLATSGARPYLYFTQFRYASCRQTPDRDLMREPLEVSP